MSSPPLPEDADNELELTEEWEPMPEEWEPVPIWQPIILLPPPSPVVTPQLNPQAPVTTPTLTPVAAPQRAPVARPGFALNKTRFNPWA